MLSSQRINLSKSVLESPGHLLGKTDAFLQPLSFAGVVVEAFLLILI